MPPEVIRHAVWLCLRFALGYRDVEDRLAERGIDVLHETVRQWTLKFGHVYAKRIQPTRREYQHPGSRSPGSAQRLLATHSAVRNHFNAQRHVISRRTLGTFRAEAFAGWREAAAA